MSKQKKVQLVVLLGCPGSGKSMTGDQFLEQNCYAERIVVSQTLGDCEKMRKYKDSGGNVPDKIVIPIIREKIQELAQQTTLIVLDGGCRTVQQFLALKAMSYLVDLHIFWVQRPIEDCVKNILESDVRKKQRRSDDNAEILQKRIQTYNEETLPVLAKAVEMGYLVHLIQAQKMEAAARSRFISDVLTKVGSQRTGHHHAFAESARTMVRQ